MEDTRQAPDQMNAQALATYLGVTERTVRRWIKRGDLPAERQGRAYEIRREDGERMRVGSLGRVVDDRSSLERLLADRNRELAVLQGRYAELQERARKLEDILTDERRRSARLEYELELVADHGLTRKAA